MFDWVEDLVRTLLWGLTGAILWLMDMVYTTVYSLGNLDISNFEQIWEAFGGVSLFIGVFVGYRIISKGIKKMFDFEEKEQFNPMEILLRTIVVSVIVIAFPLIFAAVNTIGTLFQQNVSIIMGVENDMLPSTVIISSYVSDGQDNYVQYTLDQVSINAVTDTGEYKFFPGFDSLFIVAILGITSAIILIAIGLSIGKRIFELLMLVLISPLPLSSMVFKEGDLSGTWLKAVASVYFSNFISIAGMILAIQISVSPYVQTQGTWIQIIVLIGALLGVLSGTPQLAKFIGADGGSSDTLQQIAHIRMAGAGAFRGVKSAFGIGKSLMGAGATGLSAGIYGIGRAAGGQSIRQMGGIDALRAGVSRMSKDGSFARKIHDKAIQNPAAQAFENMGRHMYSSSAQRFGKSKGYSKASSFNERRRNSRFKGDQ